MKPTVYIETTVPSYYFETRPGAADNVRRTRQWWDDERSYYELFTSQVVLLEIQRAPEPKRQQMLQLAADIPLLELDPETEALARVYSAEMVMPRNPFADALHLAIATHYKVDFLLTWNCRHLANENKRRHLETVNARMHRSTPIICTPLTLQLESES